MSNYKAIVAKVDRIVPIQGADRIVCAFVLGEATVVSNTTQVGDIGLLFISGTQLSHEYCYHNNLYRDKEKNKDTSKAGFFDDNRRVRAQPFKGVSSAAYFTSLESLSWVGTELPLNLGDSFEDLNGVNICKKFISEQALKKLNSVNKPKAKKPCLTPYFLEHVDTGQFKQNVHLIKKGDLISIQSKKHGTSQRVGYTKKIIELPKWKQLINKAVNIFPTETYDYVVGTRRVVLGNINQEGFHGSEQYRFDIAEQLKPFLVKGMEIYLEVVGWVNGKPIMSPHKTSGLKNKAFSKKYGDTIYYSYGCKEGAYDFHIYRITLTTEDGNSIDYTQPQLVDWCTKRGFKAAMDVIEPFVYNDDRDSLISLVEALTEREEVLCEDFFDPSHISEGVIVRVDRETTVPLFLKSKSFMFKVLEGIATEQDVDIEDIS